MLQIIHYKTLSSYFFDRYNGERKPHKTHWQIERERAETIKLQMADIKMLNVGDFEHLF